MNGESELKTNLANFPKADFSVRVSDAIKTEYIIKVDAWQFDFKKELQQLRAKMKARWGIASKGFEEGFIAAIDEILGENNQ